MMKYNHWFNQTHFFLQTGTLLALALMSILLSGCGIAASGPMGPGAGTPEAAAIQTITGPVLPMPDFQVDRNTIKVRQSVPLGDHFLVVITFRGFQNGNGAGAGMQNCMFTYEVLRARLGGWSTGNGGGGCSGEPNGNENLGPMSIGASNNGGSGPGNAGYSSVDGQVYQKDIVNVLVTWNDTQVQKVPVVDGTFIAVRAGQFQMQRVDGLNEEDQVVYSSQPQIAPGKK
jgi:hypothetical protein